MFVLSDIGMFLTELQLELCAATATQSMRCRWWHRALGDDEGAHVPGQH